MSISQKLEKCYKNQIENIKNEKNYEALFQEYLNSNMSIKEFCKNKNLTDKDREWLELKEKRKKILEETKKQEEEKLRELVEVSRRKKNGR